MSPAMPSANDVSERSFQIERGGQWTKGKGCPTFGPLGPWLVTRDEVKDVQDLDMFLDVNGKHMQTGNTSTMIFGVAHLVHYVSQFMLLEAGDVITTGTPAGRRHGDEAAEVPQGGETSTSASRASASRRRRWSSTRGERPASANAPAIAERMPYRVVRSGIRPAISLRSPSGHGLRLPPPVDGGGSAALASTAARRKSRRRR